MGKRVYVIVGESFDLIDLTVKCACCEKNVKVCDYLYV